VVQKTPELMNWRPTAGAKGARGNSVNLIAKLQQKGGAPSTVKAAEFIWELTKSSKEPGYAMNAEIDSPNSNVDLKIESGPDGLIILDSNAQKAQSKAGEQTQSTATIASYDWGAFGTIKVTAMLPDGSPLVGYLEGDAAQTDIRLPLRSADSNIADIWKQQHGVSGFADSADFEADPVGDSNAPGDGLTLYEEYRGFIMNGIHIEGNPKKKDYFIVNTAGGMYQSGISLFQSLSGLEVHSKFRKTEVPLNRVINKNHNEGAHKGDQHAVVISTIAANAGYCEATGGPGPPRMISQVVAPKIMPNTSYGYIAYLNPSLTHELFHACNVYHHGEGRHSLTLQRLPDDTVLAGGAPANVITEEGVSAAPLLPVNVPFQITIGIDGDTHSGDDNCVMRYDDSSGYFSATDARTVYFVGREDSGDGICAARAGTGINGPRTPQPRYGDGAPGRGNCQGQIMVNDTVAAPAR
jgi:hypothetical protein